MTPERKAAAASTTLGGGGTSIGSAGSATAPALTIVYHPDLRRVGDRALVGSRTLLSRTEPDFAPPGRDAGEPLADAHLSRRPLRLEATDGGGVALETGESGTAVVASGKRARAKERYTAAQLRRGVVLELGKRIVLLLHAVAPLQEALGALEGGALAGESEGIRRVLWEIRSVADLDVPVLLRGETGSGKELVARAIHDASPRRDRPFVAVNLGAVAPTLAVAELFGAVKGGYTGSTGQPGYFEKARGGTLFLDEIGEAPPELQVALLRALETGEIQTVGSQELRKADVRVVAATDADLEAKVAAGTYRAPLLNRLSACEIWIPPLRERRDDIGRLFVRFLRDELDRTGEAHRLTPPEPTDKPWLPPSLVARLADYDWPGNVRQLRNVVRQLVIGSRGRDRLEITAAVERLLEKPAAAAPETLDTVRLGPAQAPPPAAARDPSDVTKDEIAAALQGARWELAAAARQLGVTRPSLYNMMARHGFRRAQDLPAEEISRHYESCGGDIAAMAERLEVSEKGLAQRVRGLGLK